MKKKIILNILVFIFTLPVFCQFGIKGGVNLSTLTNYTSASYRFGGHIGLTFEKRLSDKWYFQPELILSSSGTNFGDISSVIKGGHVEIWNLDMPLNMSFRPSISDNIKLVTDMGIYIGYGLWGKEYCEYYEKDNYESSPFNEFNRFNFGLNIGLGLQIKSYFGGITYQHGLTDAAENLLYKHRVFRFSLGYKF